MAITKFEIDMLNVKAADAFLLHLFTDTNEYVVLVDAGNEGDGQLIIDHIRKYYTQQYIDLVIITHCDSDHYGGMKELIDYNNRQDNDFKINKVWVNDPYKHVDINDVKYIRKNDTLKNRLNDAFKFNDGSNLLELIDDSNIVRKEVFAGNYISELGIKILGPTKYFYESLIPGFRVNLDFKEEQIDDIYTQSSIINESAFYSKTLEDASDDPSKVNQSSIIFSLTANNDVFLFTGDAGKEALTNVISSDSQKHLKDIKWLKVPHHGSKHNLNNKIIEYLHPSICYISTEKYGKYANRCTVIALKKVGKVYSTHKESCNIWYHEGTDDRRDYYTINPL
jgi:beta-lactamase superfamily II metal-dependent hydrolase